MGSMISSRRRSGRGPSVDVQRRPGQQVHPDIVVLVDRPRLVPLPVHVLRQVLAGTVHPVGLSPQLPLPIAGLTEEVIPGESCGCGGSRSRRCAPAPPPGRGGRGMYPRSQMSPTVEERKLLVMEKVISTAFVSPPLRHDVPVLDDEAARHPPAWWKGPRGASMGSRPQLSQWDTERSRGWGFSPACRVRMASASAVASIPTWAGGGGAPTPRRGIVGGGLSGGPQGEEEG